MIPIDFITEWRTRAPWMLDSQVEQDLIISRILVELYSNPETAEALAFRGGTAIYKLYVDPPSRYSEDIDLVQVKAEPIGTLIDEIRSLLDPWLGEPRRSFSEGRATLTYRVLSEGPPSVPLRVKLEINTREHISVLGMTEILFSMESRWHAGSVPVRTYHVDELLGTKLRALYQRKKGRDLYDLWSIQGSNKTDPNKIVLCFKTYLKHCNLSVSRKEFEKNLSEKLEDPTFISDIQPLITPLATWNPESAVRYVREELLSRL